MIHNLLLPNDVPNGEWPDEIRAAHSKGVRDNEVHTERVMVYVPARKGRKVVVGNESTDFATGHSTCGECGGTIDHFDKYCRHCGADLEG